MNLQLQSTVTEKTIEGFIQINRDILTIPHLSVEQRGNLVKLEKDLNDLGNRKNENEINFELAQIFNRLN